MNHAVTQPFSIVWTNSGDEQLTVDGLRSLVRQLPGVLVYLDAAGAPIIGCVTAAANIGSATVQIDGETRVPVPDGANVRAQYRLRRAAVLSGVVMVSALDSVSILVTICDVSEVATADSTKTEADAAPGVDAS